MERSPQLWRKWTHGPRECRVVAVALRDNTRMELVICCKTRVLPFRLDSEPRSPTLELLYDQTHDIDTRRLVHLSASCARHSLDALQLGQIWPLQSRPCLHRDFHRFLDRQGLHKAWGTCMNAIVEDHSLQPRISSSP